MGALLTSNEEHVVQGLRGVHGFGAGLHLPNEAKCHPIQGASNHCDRR